MTKSKVLVTAALPYSNGRLHVGHIAGAYLPSDIYVRFLRLTGKEVLFISGSDDHGVAIMLTGQKEGKSPREVSDFYRARQHEALESLNIKFDIYSGTSVCPYHYKASQDFFLNLYKKNYFEKVRSQQFYDETKNIFLPDRFVKGTCGYCGAKDQNGDQCESCGKTLDVDTLLEPKSIFSGSAATKRETVHWFLDLSRAETVVKEWLKTAAVRDHTRNFVQGLVATGLVKRSMTRDIDWGIPVPIDDPEAKNKVLYVWFDAPIGYISNTMEVCKQRFGDAEKYAEWWKGDADIYHFIGEDNTIFHCVIWIAMLTAEGSFRLPTGVIVNQFLNIQFPDQEVEKISKSRGKAVWIEDYVKEGGSVDSLRYYLTMIAPERARTVYKPEDLQLRHNAELGNILGNFVHRIISFTIKYVGPSVPAWSKEKETDVDRSFREQLQRTHVQVRESLESHNFKGGLEQIMDFARQCNKYVDDKAPWTSRKTDMDTTHVTLATALDAIKFLGTVLLPYLPGTAAKILNMLALDPVATTWNDAVIPLKSGHPLNQPEILFARIE